MKCSSELLPFQKIRDLVYGARRSKLPEGGFESQVKILARVFSHAFLSYNTHMMKQLWRDHSLGVVTLAVFIAMTIYCLWAGYQVWSVEGAKTNGPFWIWWSWEYNISLVADVFGGLYLIYATKYMREKNSSQSEG